MYSCQVGSIDCAKFLVSKEIGADHTIRSYLSGRDALKISIEGHFDRITDLINNLDESDLV